MKKIVVLYIGILAAVFAVLSFVSREDEYAAEKIFYSAAKTGGRIAKNPDVAPPAMISAIDSDLKKIIQRYPETNMAVPAYISLAEVYISDKQFKEAIALLDEFIAKRDKDAFNVSRALFLKAIAYESDKKWDLARKELDLLADKYIETPFGLQAPLYVAVHYQKADDSIQAQKEFNNALNFYRKLTNTYKGKMMGYAASGYLVQTYMQLDRAEDAGDAIEQIIKDYPAPMVYMQYLPTVDYIFAEKLKKPERAISILSDVLEKITDEKMKKVIIKRIEELKNPKKSK